MPTIAQNIRSARGTRGLTQNTVALMLEVTLRTYCRWESGETVPNVPTLRRLADVLGVTVTELIEESDD